MSIDTTATSPTVFDTVELEPGKKYFVIISDSSEKEIKDAAIKFKALAPESEFIVTNADSIEAMEAETGKKVCLIDIRILDLMEIGLHGDIEQKLMEILNKVEQEYGTREGIDAVEKLQAELKKEKEQVTTTA